MESRTNDFRPWLVEVMPFVNTPMGFRDDVLETSSIGSRCNWFVRVRLKVTVRFYFCLPSKNSPVPTRGIDLWIGVSGGEYASEDRPLTVFPSDEK